MPKGHRLYDIIHAKGISLANGSGLRSAQHLQPLLELDHLFLDELARLLRGLAALVDPLVDEALCQLIGDLPRIARVLVAIVDRQKARIGDQVDLEVAHDPAGRDAHLHA